MRYILNPGDFQEVQVFLTRYDAMEVFDKTPGSRLYRCRGLKPIVWEEYTHCQAGWNRTDRNNLPVKVIEAGEK